MSGIVDQVKEAVGLETPNYPAEDFQLSGKDPALHLEQQEQNKPGERPGKQSKQHKTAIDDVYANGKPYIGCGKLEGKKAIITGGDSGIGRATAILFALEGADSTITYLPAEESDAQDTKAYVEKKTNGSRTLHLVQADLKQEANAKKVVEAHLARFGRLDILVNNAAQQLENHDITTLDSKQWEDTFRLNMHSYFYMAKHCIPHMPRGSSIINMASINGFIGRPDLLDYTSTKGAITSFTRGLSNQILADKIIRVNAIAPGPIYTPLVTATFSKSNIAGFTGPIGRPGQPVEVATCCVFLASEDSSFISGNTLHPNGGTVIS